MRPRRSARHHAVWPTDPQHRAMHEHYELGKEADRLSSSGAGRLEFERTQEIVLRHLPSAPATVADIGGGPGRYTLWLAGLGYRVVHRDIVPLHVDQVRAAAAARPAGKPGRRGAGHRLGRRRRHGNSTSPTRAWTPCCCSARCTTWSGGPTGCRRCREARRIVRPGGPVFAVGISRWAARLDAMLRLRVYEQGPGGSRSHRVG